MKKKTEVIKKFKIFVSITLSYFIIYNLSYKYSNDNITLVTALFHLPTNRHKFEDYLVWISNLLQINKPIVIFIEKNISSIIRTKRPKEYANKTIWIEKIFSELYFYKNYKKEFEETYKIDKAKNIHNIHLFIVWNEKVKFLQHAISQNYFKSDYFFWIDAGFFKEKNMTKYKNNWPSIDRCRQDPRVLLNEIRKIENNEFQKLMNFEEETHNKFMNDFNIAGNAYGGRKDFLVKFIFYYEDIFKLFLVKKKFIGSEQNIYAIISHLHPEITKIVHSGNYQFLKRYYKY